MSRTEDLRPLFRAMLLLGGVAIVILAAGIAEFLAFEPLGERTGAHVAVAGVYAYDPATGTTSGAPATRFAAGQDFAAVIDWSTAPRGSVVGAHWSNALGSAVGELTPRPAAAMTEQDRLLPVKVPPGFHRNLPGEYVLVVERYRGGQPVEVLARRLVLVRRAL